MNYKLTILSILISFMFLCLSVDYLLKGCYAGAGSCKSFSVTNVLITNINCDLTGTYNYGENVISCTIVDDSVDLCSEYVNGTTTDLYVNKNKLNKCYAESYIEMLGKLGIIFAVLAIIFFIIPIGIFAITKIIEHNNTRNNEINDIIEIQLNSAFSLDNSRNYKYSKLNCDDEVF